MVEDQRVSCRQVLRLHTVMMQQHCNTQTMSHLHANATCGTECDLVAAEGVLTLFPHADGSRACAGSRPSGTRRRRQDTYNMQQYWPQAGNCTGELGIVYVTRHEQEVGRIGVLEQPQQAALGRGKMGP